MVGAMHNPAVGADQANMPLIAPSMSAVSAAALRSDKRESAPGDVTEAPKQPDSLNEPAAEAEDKGLSKDAFEQLALKLVDRISRRMRREKDRRGQWT